MVYQESGASETRNTPTAADSVALSSIADPVSSSQSTPSAQLISSTDPAPSSQDTVPISSSKPTTLISAPGFIVSTSISLIFLPQTSTLATSTLATSNMTPATSISNSGGVSSPALSSPTEGTTAARSPPTDLLLGDEFGNGSKGIPEFTNIPQRRRHARHLQDHVRHARTHI